MTKASESPPPGTSADLALAMDAAQGAAEVIRRLAADPAGLEVRAKRPKDFVTRVDLASERVIVDTLLGSRPGHAVMSEEQAPLHGQAGSPHRWIVDPVDGTTNMIHGIPAYAVSLALTVHGRLEIGVVLDVPRDEWFVAERGRGSWCRQGNPDGKPWKSLTVSACQHLEDAVIATSAPGTSQPDDTRAWTAFAAVMRAAAAVRRSGSAALDLAWVAAGRFDASFDQGLAPWDVAAGALLIREAHGQVTTFDGGDEVLSMRETLAAGPALHPALCRILSGKGTRP